MTAPLLEAGVRPSVYPTIGIDPGQRWCALAARIDSRCLDATILDRGPKPERGAVLGQDEGPFVDRFLATLESMMDRHRDAAVEASAAWEAEWSTVPWRVAMEGIVPTVYGSVPEQIAKLRTLPATALILGVVRGLYPGVVVVRPSKLGQRGHAKHGDVLAKLGPYPRELQGFRPRRFLRAEGTDREHERSAWAVAGAAQLARSLTLATVDREGVSRP